MLVAEDKEKVEKIVRAAAFVVSGAVLHASHSSMSHC